MFMLWTDGALSLFQNSMIMQDRLEKERCDAKNAVEEYVYEMRDKLCGPYEEFCKEEVRLNYNMFYA